MEGGVEEEVGRTRPEACGRPLFLARILRRPVGLEGVAPGPGRAELDGDGPLLAATQWVCVAVAQYGNTAALGLPPATASGGDARRRRHLEAKRPYWFHIDAGIPASGVEVNVIGPEATGSRELIKKTVVLFVLLLTSVQAGAAEWLTKFSDTEHNALAGMPELADVAYLGKGSWLEGHRGVKDRSGGQISIGVIAVSAQEVTFLQWVEVAQNYTIVAKASVSGLQAVVFGRMGNYSLIELVRKNGGADSFAINSWIGGTSPGKNQVVATYLQSLVEKTKPD